MLRMAAHTEDVQTHLFWWQKNTKESFEAEKISHNPHSLNHNRAARNIFSLFGNHLDGKNSEAFSWGTTLFLSPIHRLIPDMMVVCDPSKVYEDVCYKG